MGYWDRYLKKVDEKQKSGLANKKRRKSNTRAGSLLGNSNPVSEVMTNSMPNVYPERINYIEKNNLTTIVMDVYLLDYNPPKKRIWFGKKSDHKLRINACLVEGESAIKSVESGKIILQDKDTTSVRGNKVRQQSAHRGFRKVKYRLKIVLHRKVSKDASLFFFTSWATSGKHSKIKRSNHGIFAKSKSTKRRISTGAVGPVKHLPLFKNGKRIKKLDIFKIKSNGIQWHGRVRTGIAGNKYFGNMPKYNRNPSLIKSKIDNNITMYMAPLSRHFGKKALKLKNHRKDSLFNMPFKYEMDEQVDLQGNLHKYFILNLCNLALSKSASARKIFQLNKDLFMEISETLKIGRIRIERNKIKNLNKIRKNRKSKYRKNRARYNRRRKSSSKNTVAYINMRKPLKFLGLLNDDDVHFKRHRKRQKGKLEIVKAGLPEDMKVLYFIDKGIKKSGKGKVFYNVYIDFEDVYYRYVKEVLRDMLLFKAELLSIKNNIVKTKSYSNKQGKIKRKYIEKYFKKFNVTFGRGGGIFQGDIDKTPIVRGMEALDNASSLLGIEPEEIEIDNKINFSTASPATLRMALKDINRIITLLQKKFNILPTFNRALGIGKGIKSRKSDKRNRIESSFRLGTNRAIKREFVTYQFLDFNEELKINKALFDSRTSLEMTKYFKETPKQVDIPEEFDSDMKHKIMNVSKNKYLFLTTSEIHYFKGKINTKKIGKNIKEEDFIKIKNIRKRVIKNQKLRNINFSSKMNAKIMILPEVLANKDENKKDNTLEIRRYLGRKSAFVNSSLLARRLKNFKLSNSTSRLSNNFVFGNKNIASLSNFNLNGKDNDIYQDIINRKIDPSLIPLQVKSLLFSKSTATRANYFSTKEDIFKNPKTDEIAYQMYGNIQEVKYIDNFPLRKNGLYDMKSPIIKKMTGENFISIGNLSKLCFLQSYDSKMTINKKDPFKIYGSVFLLIGGGGATAGTHQGKTTNNASHDHHFKVDKHGNGYTNIAIHPNNPKIRHRHQIINWQIQEAKSTCYPNCKDKFGEEGAPPHSHNIIKKKRARKIRTSRMISKRMTKSFEDTWPPRSGYEDTWPTTMDVKSRKSNSSRSIANNKMGGKKGGY